MFRWKVYSVLMTLLMLVEFSIQQGKQVTYKCEPLTMNYCTNLGYNSTIMPNILNHKSQKEAARELYRYARLSLGTCEVNLWNLVCSVYIPMCNTYGRPIPPCKSFCSEVKRECQTVMRQSGFDWPKELDCNKFPVSNTTGEVRCINRDQATSVGVSRYDGTILYSDSKHINSFAVINGKIEKSKMPSISTGVYLDDAAGLAVDYSSERLIYGDSDRGTINSVFFNGSNHFVIAEDQGEVIRIDFDPVKRILYWVYQDTLVRHSAIKYMKLLEDGSTGSNIRTLLDLPLLAYVTGIAVDECGENIFWGQASQIHGTAIQRTDLVHVSTQTIISTEIKRPSALTIDHQTNQLYWSDRWMDKIERCDFDGRHRVIIAEGKVAQVVYGMTIYGDYLYWSECLKKMLYRADKMHGGELIVIEANLKSPMDVALVANNTNECMENDYEDFII